jgi:hypothetical protein
MARAADVDGAYLPSRESLQYHVEHNLGQIADLDLSRVRELFVDDWPNGDWLDYYIPALGRGTLKGRFGYPTPDDLDRLWANPEFRARFTRYLELDHLSFSSWEMGQAHQNYELEDYSRATGAQAASAWTKVWEVPDAYPHWAFLMEVARRFQQ